MYLKVSRSSGGNGWSLGRYDARYEPSKVVSEKLVQEARRFSSSVLGLTLVRVGALLLFAAEFLSFAIHNLSFIFEVPTLNEGRHVVKTVRAMLDSAFALNSRSYAVAHSGREVTRELI